MPQDKPREAATPISVLDALLYSIATTGESTALLLHGADDQDDADGESNETE